MPLLRGPAIALQREKPQGFLFPKGEFLRTHRLGPLGLNGFLQLRLFPKGEFLKEPLRGVPLVECSHYLVLFVEKIVHPYEPWPLFPKGEVP